MDQQWRNRIIGEGEGEEEWRPVLGYEDSYQVSDMGRVRRIDGKRGKLHGESLKLGSHPCGYLAASLWEDNNRKGHLVHRLVAQAFIGPIHDGKEINHRNGDKRDNRIGNLEIVTRRQNIDHAIGCGLIDNKGEKNSQAKLRPAQVMEIKAKYKRGIYGYVKLGREYGVSSSNIRQIVKGRNWKHI